MGKGFISIKASIIKNKTLELDLNKFIKEAASEALQAILKKVPVETGMAQAAFIPFAKEIKNESIKIPSKTIRKSDIYEKRKMSYFVRSGSKPVISKIKKITGSSFKNIQAISYVLHRSVLMGEKWGSSNIVIEKDQIYIRIENRVPYFKEMDPGQWRSLKAAKESFSNYFNRNKKNIGKQIIKDFKASISVGRKQEVRGSGYNSKNVTSVFLKKYK